jgi:hypothetical protein
VAAQPPLQTVTAWAYGCSFLGAKTVAVELYNRPLLGLTGREMHVPATLLSDGALEFTFRVPAGSFDIDYSVDGQRCMNGGGGLIVLPGHDRRLVVSMTPGLHVRDWHARKFVAGTLPLFPVSVSVVATNTDACPNDAAPETAATVDGAAYYVGYLYGLHMFLKIRSSLFDTLYIRLPDASPVDSNNEYVRKDITERDLQLLTKHGLNEEAQCILTPSGTAVPFHQTSEVRTGSGKP